MIISRSDSKSLTNLKSVAYTK